MDNNKCPDEGLHYFEEGRWQQIIMKADDDIYPTVYGQQQEYICKRCKKAYWAEPEF